LFLAFVNPAVGQCAVAVAKQKFDAQPHADVGKKLMWTIALMATHNYIARHDLNHSK